MKKLFSLFSLLFIISCSSILEKPSDSSFQNDMSFSHSKSMGSEPYGLPFPPPRGYSLEVLNRSKFKDFKRFSELSDKLKSVLNAKGYSDLYYYTVPGGFAIMTSVEQIDSEAKPLQNLRFRWSEKNAPREIHSLKDYFKALFKANKGNYRLFLFIVSDKAFSAGSKPMTKEYAEQIQQSGTNSLPDKVSDSKLGSKHKVSVLVYTFRKPNPDEEMKLDASIPARAHLKSAGLLSELE